jgi:hypothetical protein
MHRYKAMFPLCASPQLMVRSETFARSPKRRRPGALQNLAEARHASSIAPASWSAAPPRRYLPTPRRDRTSGNAKRVTTHLESSAGYLPVDPQFPIPNPQSSILSSFLSSLLPIWSPSSQLLLTLVLIAPLLAGRVTAATLGFSTYLGGAEYEGAYAVAVDSTGNVYVGGSTESVGTFPLLNPFQPDYGGGDADAFIAKFNPEGRLIFSTYFGGAGYDAVNDLAVDRDGNLLVVGETRSVDLPATPDAFQESYGGGSAFGHGDGFIARFSPDGRQLLYCSYLGGSGDERIWRLAIDPSENICLTGHTDSRNFPLKNALQSVYGGGDSDGFIAKFNSSLSELLFSTYIGGNHRDEDLHIAVDPVGLMYVGGRTLSTNFPVTPGAFQTQHLVVPKFGDNWDGFIAKLVPDGSSLFYSTYVGSATADAVFGIAADAEGSAYVTGSISASWDEGTFPLGFQPEPGYGPSDGWVAKLKPDGSNFEWFSYLGGSGGDSGFDIGVDQDNNIHITGITTSADFPTRDAPQPQFAGGGQDAFVARISPDGMTLLHSSYLGGSRQDWGYRLAVHPQGGVLVVGQTWSQDYPSLNAFQSTNATTGSFENPADAVITRITPAIQAPTLRIARSGSNVLVTWSTNFSGFVLQSRATLSEPTDWRPVTATPIVLGGQFTVVQPVANTSQLFRLQRP